MGFFKGFVEWFCGKKETATSKQFSKMIETVEKKAGEEEKKE
ncbi:MAG: hypothetical protein Q4Q53_00570 [Methanocorpusculum sp.]|nr:hypothetical protein [Methanocorpusculum sp.]